MEKIYLKVLSSIYLNIVFERFIFSVEEPRLTLVEVIALQPDRKGLHLFVLRPRFFPIFFVHREQSGQCKRCQCLILFMQLWPFNQMRVHWWMFSGGQVLPVVGLRQPPFMDLLRSMALIIFKPLDVWWVMGLAKHAFFIGKEPCDPHFHLLIWDN